MRVAFRLVEARGCTRAVGLFGRSEDDPKLVAAHAEAEGALPEGWKPPKRIVSDSFSAVPRRRSQLDVWAAAGEGPSGELELAVACDKAAISRIKC